MMVDITTRMSRHTSEWLEHLGIDRAAMQNEGLGLRPLTSADILPRETREKLARRFYRLAQWREISQGAFWLNVSRGITCERPQA